MQKSNLASIAQRQPVADINWRVHLRTVRRLAREEIADLLTLLMESDIEGLRALHADPQAPALPAAVAAIILRAHSDGDVHALDALLNRIIGKVRDEVAHVKSADDTGSRVVVMLPSNGRETATTRFEPRR